MRLSLISLLFFTGAASAQSLPQLMQSALAADPGVAGAQAQIRAADKRVVQARAAFGPTASVGANVAESRYAEAPDYEARHFRAKQIAFQVNQPLYRLPLFSSLEGAQAQYEQTQAALQQARAETMQRLVEVSFEVLKARDAVALAEAQRLATGQQLAAAQKRFKVGSAPITDVREAEAKADSVNAQLDAARFDLELKQQVLVEVAGTPATTLLDRGLTGERVPPVHPGALQEWLNAALANSPQLRQAQQGLAVAQAEVKKADQAHVPTADLNYSFTRSSDTGTVTSIFPRRGRNGQLSLSVNVPLFASGATQAKVDEARALLDKAQSDVDSARRTVTLGVRQTFTAALSSISQAKGLDTAVRSQELSLRANRRGYEVGVKVNAEVLESQSRLFEARRDLSRARYDAWLSYIKLRLLAGSLDEADVELLDGLLVSMQSIPEVAPRRSGDTP